MDKENTSSGEGRRETKKGKRSPDVKCCLCTVLINTNVRKRMIKTPSTWKAFFALMGSSATNYNKNGVLCSKCHGKAQYAYKKHPNSETLGADEYSEDSEHSVQADDSLDQPQEISQYSETEATTPDELEDAMGLEVTFENSMSLEVTIEPSSIGTHNSTISTDSQMSSSSSIYHLTRMQTVPSTQSSCFLCKNQKGRNIIPKAAVKQVWDKLQILIPMTNRCCKTHLSHENRFHPEDLQNIVASKVGIDISSSEFGNWLMAISMNLEQKIQPHRYSFEDDGIEDDAYKMLTSLTKAQFDEVYNDYLTGYVRNSTNRSARDALGMMLMILRKNLTQDIVAFMFGTTQPVVSTSIKSVRQTLLGTFVPRFLGVDPANHITRQEAVEKHSVDFFNQVFEKPMDRLGLAADATYIDVEKPGPFGPQKKTFSAHRHKNLIKVMLVVFPDGYILDAQGPYWADGASNDATIMKQLFAGTDLKYFTDEGDFYLVDRGFRDAVEDIREYEVDVYMPYLMQKNQKTFTVEQTADSRKVTACRWIVEAVNGRLKNVYKFFAGRVEAGYWPTTIMEFCKICCALLNKFRPPLLKNQEKHNRLARRILEKSQEQNMLKLELDAKEITSRFPSEWTKITMDGLPDFPRLSMEEMITLTCGIYQVRMGQRYVEHNADDDGNLVLLMHKEEENLYRMKLASRFQSNVQHQVFFKINPTKEGLEAIEGYVCDCKVGLRVTGSCSHTAAVIRFLCYNRYNASPIRKRKWEGVMDAREELNKLLSQ